MEKNREKQFVKNTMILSIGTFSSKILSFFLLPLYTTVLTTEDYGNVDILQSVIQLAMPIVTIQLTAALFRFLIDSKTIFEKTEVITGATVVILFNTILGGIVLWAVHQLFCIEYFSLFLMTFFTSVVYGVVQNIVRGFGNNKLYSIANFLLVLTSLLANIVLIIGFGFKGNSILIAIIFSNSIASLVMIIKEKLWKYISFSTFSTGKIRELMKYSLPLVPNEISWWITNASDRFLILHFLGSASNGIYAAANKIPGIFTTIYSVFNLAWVESISKSIDDSDYEVFINNMIERCYRFFICLCLGMVCSLSLVFNFLIGEEYATAYPHVLILIIAIFFNSMCAMYGGIFVAFKESKAIGRTTVVGAFINIFFNILFIKHIGLYAASLSTLASYLSVYIIRVIKASKLVKFKWPFSFLGRAAIACFIVVIGYFYRNDLVNFIILLGMMIWCIFENWEVVKGIFNTFINYIKHKK